MYPLYFATVAHHAGGGIAAELFHGILRGFAFHAGWRIASALPLGLIIIIFIGAGLYLWYQHSKNK